MLCHGRKIRFSKPANNQKELITKWYQEVTNMYGTKVTYFTYNYRLSTHDSLYGEDVTASYGPPIVMTVLAHMQSDSTILNKFGYISDSDATVLIPIRDFCVYMNNPNAEPKAGDKICFYEIGAFRPHGNNTVYLSGDTALSAVSSFNYCISSTNENTNYTNMDNLTGTYPPNGWLRGPMVFEVTERKDYDIPGGINPLGMAGFVWKLVLKRSDYTHSPSEPREAGSNQTGDGDTLYGKLSGGTTIPEPARPYNPETDDKAKENWDHSKNGNLDSVYGDYSN